MMARWLDALSMPFIHRGILDLRASNASMPASMPVSQRLGSRGFLPVVCLRLLGSSSPGPSLYPETWLWDFPYL